MNWNITLNSPWFEYIKNGEKKYEGRCNWKQAAQYNVGDLLLIKHHTDVLEQEYTVRIINILKFDTFESALYELGLPNVLPGIKTIKDGIDVYLKYYKLETQIENGVLMIAVIGI